jgi:succinate-acetate transporter protein
LVVAGGLLKLLVSFYALRDADAMDLSVLFSFSAFLLSLARNLLYFEIHDVRIDPNGRRLGKWC